MKTKDIRELSVEETRKHIRDFRDELVKLRVQKEAARVENPARIRVLRRSIARYTTILNEKESQTVAAVS